MAKNNRNDGSNPRKIADAIKGREDAEEELRTKQSRINRSEETQAALDMLLEQGKKGEK